MISQSIVYGRGVYPVNKKTVEEILVYFTAPMVNPAMNRSRKKV